MSDKKKSKKEINVLREGARFYDLANVLVEHRYFSAMHDEGIRYMFNWFYKGFVNEVNLTPDEQHEIFMIMKDFATQNQRNFIGYFGLEFTEEIPEELVKRTESNNAAMREQFLNVLGEERMNRFESYYKERKTVDKLTVLERIMKHKKLDLDTDQKDRLREWFYDRQEAAFDHKMLTHFYWDKEIYNAGILDEEQAKYLESRNDFSNAKFSAIYEIFLPVF